MNRRRLIIWMTTSIVTLTLGSCQLLVDMTTDDSVDQIIYEIKSPFTELSLLEDMDLELIESPDSVLIIDGPKAILDNLTISENDGKVEITYKKKGDWKYEKPVLQLKIPQIVPIRLYKFNDLYAKDTLRTENLDLFSDGTGDIHLMVNNQRVYYFGTNISQLFISGKTNQLDVSVTYASCIKGASLKADTVNVNSYGSNDQVVYPLKKMSCTISYKGNVIYVNKPDELNVNIVDNAEGRVIFNASAH